MKKACFYAEGRGQGVLHLHKTRARRLSRRRRGAGREIIAYIAYNSVAVTQPITEADFHDDALRDVLDEQSSQKSTVVTGSVHGRMVHAVLAFFTSKRMSWSVPSLPRGVCGAAA